MSFDITKLDLTPMQVLWTPNASTTTYDLGATLGDVKIQIGYEKAEVMADQTGKMPVDRRVSGAKIQVTTEVAQVNDFSALQFVFPAASATSASGIQWNNQVGHSDISVAGQLRLHPLNQDTASTGFDWIFFVACPIETSEITYGPTKQSALKVEWGVYPDTSVTPYRFVKRGT